MARSLVLLAAVLMMRSAGPSVVSAQNLPAEIIRYADVVLYNGKILTVNENFDIVQGVTIRDSRFLAVGDDARVLSMAGPETTRIDLQGKTVVPGFIATDADNDFAGGNLYKDTQVNGQILETLKDIEKEDVLVRVREMLKDAPSGEMAFFRFDRQSKVTELTKEDLDKVTPNNPVWAGKDSSGVANSLLLEKVLKILPKDHPHILKDERTGEPNGRLYGFAHGVVGWDLRPWPPVEQYVEEQKRMIDELNAEGVTTLIGHIQGFTLSIFNVLVHRGELNIRVRGSHDFLRQNGFAESYLRRLGNLVDFGLGDMVQIVGGGLQAIDGNAYDGSALTMKPKRSLGPYLQGPYGTNHWLGYGAHENRLDDPSLDRSMTEWTSVMAAIKYGWNFTAMHNVGDRAMAIWIEAIEKGLAQPDLALKPQFRPFGLDHNLYWSDSQTERVKKLDIRRGLGKMWQRPDMAVELYGEAIHDVQPVPHLIEQGLKVHIEGSHPLEEIQHYVTRKDDKGRIWGPDHAIDRKTALRMKTLWAARFIAEDDRLGSIEPGKLADLVVLGEDYLTVSDSRLAQIPVDMTVVEGRIVYRGLQ